MNNLTLEEFVIENTNINKEFINEFFNIQKMNIESIHKPFIIDLDLVAKWLNSLKKDLKDTLLKSYVKDVDFIFLNINNDDKIDKGGNPQNHTITLKNKGLASSPTRM
jgi:hypothetical protein